MASPAYAHVVGRDPRLADLDRLIAIEEEKERLARAQRLATPRPPRRTIERPDPEAELRASAARACAAMVAEHDKVRLEHAIKFARSMQGAQPGRRLMYLIGAERWEQLLEEAEVISKAALRTSAIARKAGRLPRARRATF